MTYANVKRIVDTIQIEVDVHDAYKLWAVLDKTHDQTPSMDDVFTKICAGLFMHTGMNFSKMLDRYKVTAKMYDLGDGEEAFIKVEQP